MAAAFSVEPSITKLRNTVENGRVPYFLYSRCWNVHFNSDTIVDDHIKLSHFQIRIQAESSYHFQKLTEHFVSTAQILSFLSVVSTLSGHNFTFVNTYKHIMASNNEMLVNLTFGRKHEKSTQKDCKWNCLHYTGCLLLPFTSIGLLQSE